ICVDTHLRQLFDRYRTLEQRILGVKSQVYESKCSHGIDPNDARLGAKDAKRGGGDFLYVQRDWFLRLRRTSDLWAQISLLA
ncbi:MAG: hypothetical protein P8H53_08305, partial [Paracoccaceae bacterium]|nr:hypothetical protein [Paracoccaceae bacterium]